MLPSLAARMSGALLMAAGALTAVTLIVVELVYEPLFYLFGLVGLLMLLGLPALQHRLRSLGARIGLWAAIVSLLVLVLLFAVAGLLEALTGFDPDESDALGIVLVTGFFGLVAGLTVLGIAAAVEKGLPVVPSLVLALALPVGLLVAIAIEAAIGEEESSVGAWIAFGGLAVALVWIGYELWAQRGRARSDEVPANTA